MSIDLPTIYVSCGSFLIYDEAEVTKLRERRLIGQHIGCPTRNPHQVVASGLPCIYSNYAAKLILDNGWARFVALELHKVTQLEQNKLHCEKKLRLLQEVASREFIQQREDQLKRRNISISSERIGKFDPNKMRILITDKPSRDTSSLKEVTLNNEEVSGYLRVDSKRMAVFEDLYRLGYYITAGTKFGSDFLAYGGDPVDYHAQYCVRLAPNLDGHVDLSKLNYNEINAFHRLCHTANKQFVLSTVIDEAGEQLVKYWTKIDREYLMPQSLASDLDIVELKVVNHESRADNEYSKKFLKIPSS